MNKPISTAVVALLLAGVCAGAAAAPLDLFLSAHQNRTLWKPEIEIAYDVSNDKIDIFSVREKDGLTPSPGDYRGAHIRAGVAVLPRLWVEGGFWHREIDYRSVRADVKSWQLATQYRIADAHGFMPSVALRFSAWGNYADDLTKRTVTRVGTTRFQTATITKPKDNQYQMDLIGTWPVGAGTEISAFAGAGISRVTFDQARATTRRANGCEYDVAFTDTQLIATLAKPCDASVVITRYSEPNGEGIDPNREAKYDATHYQAGVMAKWQSQQWRLRAGYQYQTIQRDRIDTIISQRGATPYESNQRIIAEVGYRLLPNTLLFLRGQYMTNQFNGEVPMAYNTITASRFNQRYGFLSTGIVIEF